MQWCTIGAGMQLFGSEGWMEVEHIWNQLEKPKLTVSLPNLLIPRFFSFLVFRAFVVLLAVGHIVLTDFLVVAVFPWIHVG